ncbi:Phage gp6-like head-tail connector protein [Ruegeria denitrificans]|uniref:Phage gp6-like head-tail connector protein n=1 Tax=Ruegeria denitrificans TaxID=1715692 RepID=A0A0P1I460_9RHOB|nr:head-tail connector protein [Ruegeria denitrificans]CUJ89157.1 Phage gp6-like head-tail connector protein [Ruegeria denitrificans]
MMLIEETAIADAALPVDQFKAHLRLGTGFAEGSVQNEVLNGFLRAAIAAIEARTGKVLIEREFSWSLSEWRDAAGEVLPAAPVTAVDAVTVTNAAGVQSTIASGDYRLEQDSQRPRLRPTGPTLPNVTTAGSVKITFTAGMSADWGGLPADLGQAVLLLAAHYYEYRDETALGAGCMPFGVTSLIQRYRAVRFGAGVTQ